MSPLSSEGRAALMRRLERAAASKRGLAILQQHEIQDLLDELRYLRANQNFRIERLEDAGWIQPQPHYGPPGQVLLRTRMRVNGRELYAQQVVDEFAWSMYGSDLHEHLKTDLKRRLVEGLVGELDPLVEVHHGPRLFRNPFVSPPAGTAGV